MFGRFVIITSMMIFSFSLSAHADNAIGEEAYAKGEYELALSEFTKSAENDDMNAQYNLGVMYEHGHGVTQSDLKAGEWYQLAADNGHPDAPMALQLLYEYF
ncbi:MAG: sel1 repeat family protein [Kordiimonadaceae bacterium]|jgi:uncharacterized protein|nr:sel1 repeat family protein [Kordiimonadaceae bacterium]